MNERPKPWLTKAFEDYRAVKILLGYPEVLKQQCIEGDIKVLSLYAVDLSKS